MTIILAFFSAHWIASIFAQTFFLHRYAAHGFFRMSRFWEKFFHLFTVIAQGPSYLNPTGYAILHRLHHAFSDTKDDPHSPSFSPNALKMMLKTKHRYDDFAYMRENPPEGFAGGVPRWDFVDSLGQSWIFRIAFGALYVLFYYHFVPAGQWGWYLLLPIHWLMGPIHGAIVNWCGHKYGYTNYKNHDNSRNTLPIDFITWGELYQNNHHANPTSPNLAQKWFEIDLAYQVIKVLLFLRIIKINDNIPVWTDVGKTLAA